MTAESPAGAVLDFAPPKVVGVVHAVDFVASHASGTAFPIGETVVTFSATDLVTGDVVSCAFSVTVRATPERGSEQVAPPPAAVPVPPAPVCGAFGTAAALAYTSLLVCGVGAVLWRRFSWTRLR